jgi:hypothetical protein
MLPQELIFKIWVSEMVFPAFWEHILKKISASQNKLLGVKFVLTCRKYKMGEARARHKLPKFIPERLSG